MKRKPSGKKKKAKSVFVLGQDMRSDGETRITKGDNYVVAGGTEKSHDETVEIVATFAKKLGKEGDPRPEVAHEILKDIMQKKGYVPAPRRDAKAN